MLTAAACGNKTVPQNTATTYSLLPGDILFQDLDCGPACDAIERVTEGVGGRDFSHCGIVCIVDGRLKVIEAYGKVQATDIDTFLHRSSDSAGRPKVLAGRVKDSTLARISAQLSLSFIGQPYDDTFKLDNGAWYCSELVYEVYKQANRGIPYFSLNAMTFKEPGTDSFMPYWQGYYNDMGVPIPQGDSGINPGALSRSPHLDVWELTKQ